MSFMCNNLLMISSKKVVIPGINIRNFLPLSTLLTPKELIVTMSLSSLLAQVSINLKGVLDSKEIAQLPSVKFYSKLLICGTSSLSLNALYALSKTLGVELEVISTLQNNERFNYLRNLQKSISVQRVSSNILSKYKTFNDPYQVLKFRKGLSLQSRSVIVASSIFLPHSIVFGLPIDKVDITIILNSCKAIWLSLSLQEEEFDFLLKKEAYFYLSSSGLRFKELFNFPLKNSDCVRLLLLSEFELFNAYKDNLSFDEDYIILRSENNLTLLESDFRFIKRLIPSFPDDVLLSDYDLSNNLVRVAINQRREHVSNLGNLFKLYQKTL